MLPVASTAVALLFLHFQAASSLVLLSSSSSTFVPKARYNFGPASSRDDVLYSAERPGNPPGRFDKVDDEQVFEWIDFMKGHKVSRVVALLDDNEFVNYEPTGLLNMYRQAGLQCIVQPMDDPAAPHKILSWLADTEKCGERVVTHCTGGIGRCGRVAAAWLVHRYGLSPQQATDEVLEEARRSGVTRKGDPVMLEQWLSSGLKP
jgi:protein-tyrosine phosphatase